MAKQVRVWTGTQWDTLAVQLPSVDNPVFTGTTSSPMFSATQSVGDEGGEVKFAKAATNTTLDTGVTLDVYQDKVRLFETGGTNRGGYFDMSTLGAGVGTNLAPGLNLITSATIGSAVTSVTVSNCFSSTYDAYKIFVTGGAASAGIDINFQLGSTTTGYYRAGYGQQYTSGTIFSGGGNNLSYFPQMGTGAANGLVLTAEIINPNLAKRTWISCTQASIETGGGIWTSAGFENSNTQHTNFTLISTGGSMTGGTIAVYGYRKS